MTEAADLDVLATCRRFGRKMVAVAVTPGGGLLSQQFLANRGSLSTFTSFSGFPLNEDLVSASARQRRAVGCIQKVTGGGMVLRR